MSKFKTLKTSMQFTAMGIKVGILSVTLNTAETAEELATRFRRKVQAKLESELNRSVAVVLDDFNGQAEVIEVPYESVCWTVDAHI